ncbi:Ferredoxin-dependent bilin reductase [Gracilaria domingensis]|nr:Ferredoxin-dependent bilin reductase [Gracilaria domingensis]
MSAAGTSTSKAPKPVKDIYTPFWNHATSVLKARLPDLAPYPIPEGFEHKEAMVGKGKRAGLVETDSYAYCTPKLRQIRTAHVQGGQALQVLNFVMFPGMEYDLPFFGADLVTLPGGHLIALDMQPLFHNDEYRGKYSKPLEATFLKHQHNLPWGGDFPEEAARFFSPNFLWSRPSEDDVVETHVFEAFKDYLNKYLDFVEEAEPVSDPQTLAKIKESQIAYLKYRAEKDPARGMFLRFYGEEWTEEYIHGFLFDLERKIENGEYRPPA